MVEPELSIMEDVVATDDLTITLAREALHVARVKPGAVQGCAWPLLKAIFGSSEMDADQLTGFFSLTQDEEELTLVMDSRCRRIFDEAATVAAVEYAPHRWCAFEMHLGSLAWEVPGLVCYLATLMAESQISILNLSSHDRDFLLVRESDVVAAKQVIRQHFLRDVTSGIKEAISEKAITRRSGTFSSMNLSEIDLQAELTADAAGEQQPVAAAAASANGISSNSGAAAAAHATANGHHARPGGAAAADGTGERLSATSADEPSDFRLLSRRGRSKELLPTGAVEELVVKVLPTRLAVVRLQASMLRRSAHALVQRLLFTPPNGARCFWSFLITDDEISLILDETSLPLFPPEAIVGPSTRWRPLRLCGKTFAFDETGVVSAMYAPYEEGMPLLNFSTFSTNVSLVEDGDLERAIAAFDLPVVQAEDSEREDL